MKGTAKCESTDKKMFKSQTMLTNGNIDNVLLIGWFQGGGGSYSSQLAFCKIDSIGTLLI